jgi:glutamyl-tRNA synthetase
MTVVTRFAPSPTGFLHAGNARTALANWLLARRADGRFVLRIEDTDAARSESRHEASLLADLAWLGLDWDAGPDRPDAAGPYRQAERAALHAERLQQLVTAGHAYPCWRTESELAARRAGQHPRGAGPRGDRAGGAKAPAGGGQPGFR